MGVGFGLEFFLVLFWLVLFLIPLRSLNGNSAESLVWPKPLPVVVVLYPSWKGKRACVHHPWGTGILGTDFRHSEHFFSTFIIFFVLVFESESIQTLGWKSSNHFWVSFMHKSLQGYHLACMWLQLFSFVGKTHNSCWGTSEKNSHRFSLLPNCRIPLMSKEK